MNWDKDVLLKIVGLGERINSKRVFSFFALLVFLCFAPNPLAMWIGAGAWALLVVLLVWFPGGDSFAKASA